MLNCKGGICNHEIKGRIMRLKTSEKLRMHVHLAAGHFLTPESLHI